ncbi:MAG: zinc ABC transporter substrate-binding protein [Planctomycetes bacterium]|nr:zinc ABC transporter substrate-binding protein [Planctomycetota bacterium]
MRTRSALLALLLLAPPAASQDKIKVVTTIADLASLTRSVGGDAVEVEFFVRPGDDPHSVLAKPSMLLKLSRADAVIVMGLNYEHAFMPALLQKVRNPKVKPGGAGYLELGSLVEPLEVPDRLDRGKGADLHPLGNPHFNLDPDYGRVMAAAIRDHLITLAPGRRAEFSSNWERWDERAAEKIAEWDELLEPFRGTSILTYHNSWPYLAKRFGLVIAGTVEPKPGLPPTSRHLTSLARLIREQQVGLLLIEPWYDERRVAALTGLDGLRLVKAATTCGTSRATAEYLDNLDFLVRQIAGADADE